MSAAQLRRIALVVLAAGYGVIAPASADEVWHCKTPSGYKYTSTQKVPGDSCIRDRKAEQSIKPKPREMPQFCDANPGSLCKSVTPDEEYGRLDGADYRVARRGAVVAAIPGADPSYFDPETKWMVSCRLDKMTQTRSCAVVRKTLQIVVDQSGTATVFVGQKHFPESTTSVRIGQLRFDTADRDGRFGQSAQILPLLTDDADLVTRYMEWPNRTWVDDEFKLTGARASLKLARWLLVNGKFD